MNGSFDVTTVVFAILAVFVVWKLRSVLGTRTGNERPPLDPFARRTQGERAAGPDRDTGKVIPLPGAADRALDGARGQPPAARRWEGFAELGSPVATGLDSIAKADPTFDAAAFTAGAKAAYEAIITAFARGDKATLQPLLTRDVFEQFSKEIDRRVNSGETVDTTFVALDETKIEDAQVRGRSAQIGLRFVSKLITATRNKDGDIIDGSADTVVGIVDTWTFARDTTSRDPNWQLTATEAGR